MNRTREGQPPPPGEKGAAAPQSIGPRPHLLSCISCHSPVAILAQACSPAALPWESSLAGLARPGLARLAGWLVLCVRYFCVAPPARYPWRHPGSHLRPDARRRLRGRRHRCARRHRQRTHSRNMAPPCPQLAPQCRVSAAHRSGRCAGARGTSPASWSGLASMPRSRSSTTRARSTWWCTGSSPHRSSSPAASSRKKWRPPFGGGTGRRHTCRAWRAWTSAAAVATKGEGDTSGGGATRGGPLRRRSTCS